MRHLRLVLLCLPLAASLAACGGGSQQSPLPSDPAAITPADPGAPPVDPLAMATPSSQPDITDAAARRGAISTSGWIEDTFPGGFTLETGHPHGYVRVYTNASTQFAGRKPYVRETVSVSANGTWRALQAVSVAQASAGTPAPTPAPPAPPVYTGSVPSHIATWAYDEYWGEGARGSAAEVREYLSYAQSGLGNAKASSDCAGASCKSVFYFDPHMFYDTSSCGKMNPDAKGIHDRAAESWFVHLGGYADRGHRLQGHYRDSSCGGRTIPVYAMNTLDEGVRSYYASYLHEWAADFDMFFLDDTSGQVQSQFYGAGGGFCGGRICSSTHEMPNDASVVSEHGALAGSLTHPNGSVMEGVYNGLNFSDGRPNDLSILTSSSHFVGAVCEGCLVSAGALRPSMYAEVLNAMAEVDHLSRGAIVLMSNGALSAGSSTQINARNVTTAIAWLGYSESHTIVWPNLEENTQNLAIFPENSIYPASPLQTMESGASNLAVASGVYRREFRSCYDNRVAIGECAAVVNGTGGTIRISSAWLSQRYAHVVEMVGGDIPSGGRVALTSKSFVPNGTLLGPGQALLLVR